jgi:hypothetical protein
MYRGQLRNEHARVLKRMTIDDGIGGSVSIFDLLIPRYHCRIWRQRVDRDRRDQANVEDTAWGILGDDAPITEGDKVITADAREFIVTRIWNEKDGRARAHLEGTMRLVTP